MDLHCRLLRVFLFLSVGLATLPLWGRYGPAFCSSLGEVTPGETRRPNVVLVSLDTTRADHLSLYGYPIPTTPNLDKLGLKAVVFDKARTVVPITGPSHASIFTSLYPHHHGAFRNGIPLKEGFVTLAECLRASGYQTAAFISGWTLRDALSGLDQGFDLYDQALPHRYKYVNRERFADEVTRAACSFVERYDGDRPLFLFVHYFDPHDPYRRHPGLWEAIKAEAAKAGMTCPPKALAYDAEIAFVDRHLGILLDALDGKGLLEDGILVIVGDHGESLGEHDYWGHGRRVYEQTLYVPLIMYAPGRLPEPMRVAEPVSTLDILPTLLSLLDLPHPRGLRLQGRDLSGPLLARGSFPVQRLYFETFKGTFRGLTGIIAGGVPEKPLFMGYYDNNIKYIFNHETSGLEVYDLSTDPAETRNLAPPGGSPLVVSRLTAWYNRARNVSAVHAHLSQEDIEQLKSLGYIE